MNPLVSVCIPTLTKERLHYLREAVDSARRQTHAEIEILISDDGKDPELLAFAEEQHRLDPRVHFARNPTRLGLGGNCNAVAGRARGEYLVLIGDDDRLLPTFVERLLAAMTPQTAVAFSNHYVIDPNGHRLEEETRRFTEKYARGSLAPGVVANAAACVWQNSVPLSSSLLRTRDIQRLGIKPDLNTPEIELFARMAAEGAEFVFVPELLAEYRTHPASATSSGLMGERLLPYIEGIQVPETARQYKQAFMANIVTNVANRALREGDAEKARAMFRSPFYPSLRRDPVRVAVQRAMAFLPPPLMKWSFVAARRAARRIRSVSA